MFKVASIIVGILTIPAYLNYFDDQVALGSWFTLLALLNWLLFFDLGLGNGLKNELIVCISQKKFEKAKQLVLSSYLILFTLSFVILLVVCGIYFNTTLFKLDNLNGITSAENFELICLVTFIIVFMQFPLRLVISILLAMQKSALASLIPFVTQLLILIFLTYYQGVVGEDKLLVLNIVYGLALCFPLLVATFYVFIIVSKWTVSSVFRQDISGAMVLILAGSKFFWIQVCLLIINGSNEFIILNFNGAEDVVQYQIYFKVFSVFLIAFSTLTIPLWGAIGQAKVLGNNERILKIDKIMRLVLLLCIFGMISFCFILAYIFDAWLGEGVIEHSFRTSFIFSIYIFVMMGINYSACVANGFNRLSIQLRCLNIAVILKFAALYIFFNIIEHWTDIIIITILALLPALFIQYVFAQRILSSEVRVHEKSS